MREYVTHLVESIIPSFGYDRDCFDLELAIDTREMDVDVALPLGLIINEWVTNAFKYAYKEVDQPLLKLSLQHDTGIQLNIKDNGPGLDRESWERPVGSFGVKIGRASCRERVWQYV